MVVAGLFVGWIGKRLGNNNALLVGSASVVASLLLLAFATDVSLIYASNFVRGCSQVVIFASSYAIASGLIPPERRAKLFAVFNATFFLSWGIAGTLIVGPLIDMLIAFGYAEVFSYQMAFVVAAVMTSIGILIQEVLSMVCRTPAHSHKPHKSRWLRK